MRGLRLVIIAAFVCAWLTLPLGAAELVVNGGFEGAFTNWSEGLFTPWSAQGWFIQPADGLLTSQVVGTGCSDFDSDCWIEQDLATTTGGAYTLVFSTGMTFGPDNGLHVYWDGVEVAGSPFTDPIVQDYPPPFFVYTITGLTASSTTTQLRFLGYSVPGAVFLDDVSVADEASAPEPGTVGLIGGGIFALLWRARRRK